MKAANNARLKKLLVKQYRTKEGIRTLADIVEHQLSIGEKLIIQKEFDANKRNKIMQEMNIIKRHWVIAESWEAQENGRGSNHNLPSVKRYWQLFDELFDNCHKEVFYIGLGNDRAMQIPKMVHDFYA